MQHTEAETGTSQTTESISTRIVPRDDRVLILPDKAEEFAKVDGKATKIFMPAQAQERPVRGTVVAVGPGKVLESGGRSDMGLKPGDVVYYAKYSGQEMKEDGRSFILMSNFEVVAFEKAE